MTHQWHDVYRHVQTPAHHLDPRSKILVGLIFIGGILTTPALSLTQVGLLGGLLGGAAWMANLSFQSVLARWGKVVPFVLLMMLSSVLTPKSASELTQIFAKSMLSLGGLTLMSLCTPFPDLLRALERVRCPRVLVLFLAFLYRYTAVLGQDTERLERGWAARYFGRHPFAQWRRAGHAVAALLLRSYERAERVYAAMLARGFSGRLAPMRLLHWQRADWIFLGVSSALFGWIRWGIAR